VGLATKEVKVAKRPQENNEKKQVSAETRGGAFSEREIFFKVQQNCLQKINFVYF
jgi:hypothetical protein